jgi:16S rRNA U516 pseudouridylate synthase RsuA-like enzyme
MLERLQKIIARAGIASRRHAEELIRSGQVRVNGVVVTELGVKADPKTASIFSCTSPRRLFPRSPILKAGAPCVIC